MIFDLPPILGFLPLLVYIILMLKGKDMNVSVLISVILGAILTGESITGFGSTLQASLGSFLALIGFIIILGAGLGEVMTKTKVAHNIVHKVIKQANIDTPNKGIIISMLISTILVAMLGTLSGANAIIAPILIPIVASIGMSPDTLGVILHGAGATGYYLGPFCPIPVTIMGLTGISYGQYLTTCGIPLALIVSGSTYFSATRMQKNKKLKQYSNEDMIAEDFVADEKINKATTTFVATMILMLIYGTIVRAGASYAVVVMIVASILTGIVGGLGFSGALSTMVKGASKMFYMFFMFILFDPFLNYVAASGAFDAVAAYMQPLIDIGGEVAFMMLSSAIGVFGISGAGVAQVQIIHDLFKPMATNLSISMPMFALVLLIGSQITFFVTPTVDMVGQMGLARSENIKAMLKNGWLLTILTFIFLLIRSIIYAA